VLVQNFGIRRFHKTEPDQKIYTSDLEATLISTPDLQNLISSSLASATSAAKQFNEIISIGFWISWFGASLDSRRVFSLHT